MPESTDTIQQSSADRHDAPRRLLDPWSRRGPLPLTGYLEREGFAPLLTAILVLVAAFIVFQVIAAVVALGLAAARVALAGPFTAEAFEAAAQSLGAELIIGNSVGQALGLAGAAFVAAGWHTPRRRAFLRLRRVPWPALGLALVGLVGITPLLGWLIEFNQLLPLPESLRFLEDMRAESIRLILESDLGLFFNLLGLAVTPAICEELIFRGYAQRQLERAAGAAGGIFLTGALFGLYHIDPLQMLPLSVLGGYLAYLTWRTGSLWPAVLVHFANNAFAVVSTEIAGVGETMVEGTSASWPWYAVVGGLILLGAVLFLLHTRAPRWRPRAASPEDGSEQ